MSEKLNKQHRYPWPVIETAVNWYKQFPVPYRTISEMLQSHGVEVSHKTVFEWVQKFETVVDKKVSKKRSAAKPIKWSVNEEEVKVNGEWKHLYRAVDQTGETLNVVVRNRRDLTGAKAFLKKTLNNYNKSYKN